MSTTSPKQSKGIVLESLALLLNKRDHAGALRFWSDHYILHSAHIRGGLTVGVVDARRSGGPSADADGVPEELILEVDGIRPSEKVVGICPSISVRRLPGAIKTENWLDALGQL